MPGNFHHVSDQRQFHSDLPGLNHAVTLTHEVSSDVLEDRNKPISERLQ